MTQLYEAHAPDLVRLALVMVGDRATAEDVVQDSFLGLYRRWERLKDTGKALTYLRSSVLNNCRSVLRRRSRRLLGAQEPPAASAESRVLDREQGKEILDALRRLPHRQRETLVLRFVLDLSEEETAQIMRVSRVTVRTNTSRGRTALERMLGEAR
ncbi:MULTISPECIES: RNA polymerase sigma factor [Actinomadura]|uniref:SigE family RNA polymerase sigma factor n=1 Tax=Actinomadura litoris TaxID=2678616 RepID=A0A7K1L511_9ACTN|nr:MULTISPECIES: SigE family RNA polymerase sigma factor [Actinomadura]MBT2212503.1 SigE family RNA polymerase sigma factor [Actinomadura sp. NEAU-AAG7]MUN39479.1 SigE family RNA polymerase sigma factor [Actinomadura litoris]